MPRRKLIDESVGCRGNTPHDGFHITQNGEALLAGEHVHVEIGQGGDRSGEVRKDTARAGAHCRTHVRIQFRHSDE
ncbi:hypothetical protein CCUG63695_00232 [Mycobacteroides franklinii]|uniref:Uncharacterized protein n=1 Tax=Mycobacteroides franklinii TaxID=948102 RepID=A0A4V3HUK7_9MYCO|nr:hypothetical protein CCUG64054_00866 [Mycobacteroides franklinii]TDZ48713.1 hypothetical protein CCUG63697_03243 [Mycobacteroides franklinii]TDZ58894.1 hypothetical protein CCUG63696_00870 [Mycobacteroides franklinii]TDZ66408.1 hypothetical protein CCUG63695_00232 [Mycobacteroides franklinii]TDZ72331.1 hypothetical protein CCUG64056_00866 [Mycobacteroides franklinii]